MEKKIDITGKKPVIAGLILIVILVVIRLVTFSNSQDPALEKAVREVLWSTYSGIHLGPEINKIREEGDYSKVDSLLKKASPDAITIEQISRSEPLMSWSSKQEVIVRVHYRFPEDTEIQTEYMKFSHGIVSDWIYRHDTTAASYYLNFF